MIKSKMLIPATIGFLMAGGVSFALADELAKEQKLPNLQNAHAPLSKAHMAQRKLNMCISVAWRHERLPSSNQTVHYLVYGINGI